MGHGVNTGGKSTVVWGHGGNTGGKSSVVWWHR